MTELYFKRTTNEDTQRFRCLWPHGYRVASVTLEKVPSTLILPIPPFDVMLCDKLTYRPPDGREKILGSERSK
jgi:hypothetical protein